MAIGLLSEPSVRFCEPVLGGLIKRPYYALSNLGFIFVGLFILHKDRNTFLGVSFGYIALLVGTLSLIYDATYTRLTQLFDISGMLIFVGLLLFLSLNALTEITLRRYLSISVPGFVVAMTLIYLIAGQSGNIIFGSIALLVVFLEFLNFKKKVHINYKYFLIALLLLIIGFAAWIPDTTRILCFKVGFLNGRAIFHYLNALGIYYLYFFYSSQKQALKIK